MAVDVAPRGPATVPALAPECRDGAPGAIDLPAAARRGPVRSVLPTAAALAIYAAFATWVYGPVGWASASHLPMCSCGDQAQEVWFLAWTQHALWTGHSLFVSHAMEAPVGVNLAVNTSMPLLGVLLAPVTAAFGPVVAYNLLLHAALACSAASMYAVLRAWGLRWSAATLGGLLFGGSTYMLGQSLGHAFLTFAPLVPVVAYLVDDLVGRRRMTPRRRGLLLGGVLAAEALISPEVAAMCVLIGSAGVAGVLVLHGRSRRALAAAAWRTGAWASAVAAPLLAYPAWEMLRGTQRVSGPPHPVRYLLPVKSDLLSAVVPTRLDALSTAGWRALAHRFTDGDLAESGGYLGLPLLIALALCAPWRRVGRRVRFSLALCGVALVCSLGTSLSIAGHDTGIPLPWALAVHVPVLQEITPSRFSLMVWCYASITAAVALDRAIGRWVRATHRIRWARAGAVVAVVALVVAPLAPARSVTAAPVTSTGFAASGVATRIAAGTVVLEYPFPEDPHSQALLDQAATGMTFELVGGDAFVPGPGGASTFSPVDSRPPVIAGILDSAYTGTAGPATTGLRGPRLLAEAAAELRAFRVGAAVAHPLGADPERAVAFLTDLLGSPQRVGGLDVWLDVPERLALAGRGRA